MTSSGCTSPISIVVVYHNELKNLPGLLDSLLCEVESKGAAQIIFIDNGSTDASPQLVNSFSDHFKNFRHVHRTKNHMACARQQGLELAENDWIAYVDADTRLCGGWLVGVHDSINMSEGDTGAIGGLSTYLVRRNWHQFAQSLSKMFPMKKRAVDLKLGDLRPTNHVPTNNYLLNKKKAVEVGGFHFFFDRVGEDLEFNVRLRKDYRLFFTTNFAVTHELPGNKREWFVKMFNYGRAQSYVALLHRGGVPWVKAIPAISILLLVCLVYLFPLLAILMLVLALFLPQPSFLLITVGCYGVGEWFGLVRGLTVDLLLRQEQKCSSRAGHSNHLGLP